MNPIQPVPWPHLSLTEKVCSLITYSTVFNDVLAKEDLIKKLQGTDTNAVNKVINQLKREGYIIEHQGFITVKDLRYKISEKQSDYAMANGLMERKLKLLRFIGKLPFINFVGISGSMAARNPVSSKNRHVDVDVFIITANHTVWIVGIIAALYRTLRGSLREGHLCLNHIWDGSDMSVYNRNFYIANEVYNLIPVSGARTYYQFLQANKWVADYFPSLSIPEADYETSRRFGFPLLNKFFFLLFTLFRCLKNLSFHPLLELSFHTDHFQHISLQRRGAENGGYQQMIQERFAENLHKYFPQIDAERVELTLFPDELSHKIRNAKSYKFSYRLKPKEQHHWSVNYAKYQKD